MANRVLDDGEAARFAVLSTIGGAAFFATATIPLVLLPAVRRGRHLAAPTAYALTAGTGLDGHRRGHLAGRPIVGGAFGAEYRDVAGSSAPTSWRWLCSAWCAWRWPAAPPMEGPP